MIKKFLLSCALLLGLAANAQAATWWVRPDGGTNVQCTGLTDAAYPGSGTAQNCAFSTPVYALGFFQFQSSSAGGFAGVMAAGDTLMLDNVNQSNGQQAQYRIGSGGTGFSCVNGANYDCAMRQLPSGISAAQPTKVLGRNFATCDGTAPSAKAQLWGAERQPNIFRVTSKSNIEFQCLDITDHSSCTEFGPTNGCQRTGSNDGLWATAGMFFNFANNVTMRNIDIHGIANRGMFWFHSTGTWNWNYVNIVANGQAGVDTDDPSTPDDSWTATINMDQYKINWHGCQEAYPLVGTFNSSANILARSCASQGQGIYSDGWGNGDAPMGNMNMVNGEISWNTQDGLDSLHSQGTGIINISRLRAEGNSGMAVKTNSALVRIENSVIIGNCGFYDSAGINPLTYLGSGGFDNVCRGPGGEPVAFGNSVPGQQMYLTNNFMASNADIIIVMSAGSSTCNASTKIVSRNNILVGGNDILGGDTSELFYIDASGGNCASMYATIWDQDYDQVFGIKNGAANAQFKGSHSRYGDPGINGLATLKMTTSPYYQGTNAISLVNLTASSPARFAITGANSADETVAFSLFGSNDYYNNVRPTNWDGGPLQFGSGPISGTTANGGTCTVGSQCTGGTCCQGVCQATSCPAAPTTFNTNMNLNGNFGG